MEMGLLPPAFLLPPSALYTKKQSSANRGDRPTPDPLKACRLLVGQAATLPPFRSGRPGVVFVQNVRVPQSKNKKDRKIFYRFP